MNMNRWTVTNSKSRNKGPWKIRELSKFADWDENTAGTWQRVTKGRILGQVDICMQGSCHPTKDAWLQLRNLGRIYAIWQSDPCLWLVNYPPQEASHWPWKLWPLRPHLSPSGRFIYLNRWTSEEGAKTFCKQQPKVLILLWLLLFSWFTVTLYFTTISCMWNVKVGRPTELESRWYWRYLATAPLPHADALCLIGPALALF